MNNIIQSGITSDVKICSKCKQIKLLSEFYNRPSRKSGKGKESKCKLCHNKEEMERCHHIGKTISHRKNRKCSEFLGCHIAEQILLNVFQNVIKMPMRNHGYDFICGRGYKVDVKASCIVYRKGRKSSNIKYPYWSFKINKNIIADYFACIAFDNRTDLIPLHFWLIPGGIINNLTTLGISIPENWLLYEKPTNKIIACCNQLKFLGECV